jgi:hypothetical protein
VRAKEIWAQYQREHDVSARIGQTVGIDPKSGRLWFGECALDVVARRNADGIDSPLFFERVGYGAYLRKGGHS